jgi:hypothetical protein
VRVFQNATAPTGPGSPHCRGFTITLRHINTRKESSGQVISPTQRPLPDNRQQSQETDFHALAGFEPTIPVSERPWPKPYTARPLSSAVVQLTFLHFNYGEKLFLNFFAYYQTTVCLPPFNNHLPKVMFSKLFAREPPFWLCKITTDPHILFTYTYSVRWQVSKIKNLRTDFR